MLRMLLRTLRKKEEGQALPLVVLCLFVLVGFVAMSIDVGRLVWARTQMQAAVDASALAAAQSLPDWAHAEETAETYWLDNSGFIQSQGNNIQFSVQPIQGNKALRVAAEADIPTWFARFFGVEEWHVSADGDAESIVIDAMLVLDRSGSMCWDSHGPYGNYYGQLRLHTYIDNSSSTTTLRFNKRNPTAPTDIYGPPQPMSHYMYVGQEFQLDSEWMRVTSIIEPDQITVVRGINGSSRANHSAGAYVRANTCQGAGKGPYYPWEYVIDGSQIFVDTFNPDYDRIGYAQFSTRGTLEYGLTNSLGTLNNAIENSPDPTEFGNSDQYTNIAHGMYMGIHELTTNGRTNAKWVLVVLSDGVANRYCNGSDATLTCGGPGTTGTGSNASTARSRVMTQANQAAVHGITIYTIGYGNASDDDLMQDVAAATGGKFFKAPNAEELEEAFLTISKLTHIRLSR